MSKVIVNKVVAGWIENARKYTFNSIDLENKKESHDKLTLDKIFRSLNSMDFIKQNIDIVTLAKAIQYGYEVPYEFKVGDIVTRGFNILEIKEKQRDCAKETSLEIMAMHGIEKYILVCKAENREDLKGEVK